MMAMTIPKMYVSLLDKACKVSLFRKKNVLKILCYKVQFVSIGTGWLVCLCMSECSTTCCIT